MHCIHYQDFSTLSCPENSSSCSVGHGCAFLSFPPLKVLPRALQFEKWMSPFSSREFSFLSSTDCVFPFPSLVGWWRPHTCAFWLCSVFIFIAFHWWLWWDICCVLLSCSFQTLGCSRFVCSVRRSWRGRWHSPRVGVNVLKISL